MFNLQKIRFSVLILTLFAFPIIFSGCEFGDSGTDSSVFAGTWVNATYDDGGCTPCGKIVINSDATTLTGYVNSDDTTAAGDEDWTEGGSYSGDSDWTQFSVTGKYWLLKVDGSTLYYNYSTTSYDDAYIGAMAYTYTEE